MLIVHRPAPCLSGLVSAITAYEEDGRRLESSVEVASLVVPLIFCFQGGFSMAFDRPAGRDDSYTSFTAGLHPGYVSIESDGDAVCLQIDFTPLGARLFFDLPMAELTSRMIGLDDFGDSQVNELGRRLAGANGWPERIRAAEAFVIERIAASRRRVASEALYAYGEITSRRGDLRMAELTRELGWSRKRLVTEFREQIGLAPKALARVVRFQNATRLAASDAVAGWADIAAACGYADQAHMTREFVEFAGVPPRRWREHIGPRASETILQEAGDAAL